MQRLSNLTLTILILIASVLGVVLVQRGVYALWQAPSNAPGSTALSAIVFTPLTQDINLNTYRLYDTNFVLEPGGAVGLQISSQDPSNHAYSAAEFDGDVVIDNSGHTAYLCLGDPGTSGNCISSWSSITGTSFWKAGTDLGDIYYTYSTPASTNVGIGTQDPDHTLVLYSPGDSTNTEINIQEGGTAGDNSHWSIYHDNSTKALRFWNNSVGGGNLLALTTTSTINIDNSSHNATICLNKDGSGTDCITSWTQGDLWHEVSAASVNGSTNNAINYATWSEPTESPYTKTFTSGGYVGIGTNTPLAGLHFKGDDVLLESRGPSIIYYDISPGEKSFRGGTDNLSNVFSIVPGTFPSSTPNGLVDFLPDWKTGAYDGLGNGPGLFMDSTGHVGIGDTSPSDGAAHNVTLKIKTLNGEDASVALQSNNANWKIFNSYSGDGDGISVNDLVFQKTNSSGSPSITTILTLKYSATDAASSFINIGKQNDTGNTYIRLDKVSGAPPSGDCTSGNPGRMIYDSTNDRLYICKSTGSWGYVTVP